VICVAKAVKAGYIAPLRFGYLVVLVLTLIEQCVNLVLIHVHLPLTFFFIIVVLKIFTTFIHVRIVMISVIIESLVSCLRFETLILLCVVRFMEITRESICTRLYPIRIEVGYRVRIQFIVMEGLVHILGLGLLLGYHIMIRT
jgi:hypothetical protein